MFMIPSRVGRSGPTINLRYPAISTFNQVVVNRSYLVYYSCESTWLCTRFLPSNETSHSAERPQETASDQHERTTPHSAQVIALAS